MPRKKLKNSIFVRSALHGANISQIFLDALASLGSMLESLSLFNVFDILSNLGHIIGLSSGYVQGIFRVCSEYVQSMLRVGS